MVRIPYRGRPLVTIDLRGSTLNEDVFQTCLHLVQSCVLSAGYSHQSFFTEQTLDSIRALVSNAGVFFFAPIFDLWKDVYDSCFEEFIASYCTLLGGYLAQHR